MTDKLWQALGLYLLAVNLAAFVLMGADKRKARRGAWRISERTLFLPALLGARWGVCWGCGPFITRPGTGISAGASPCSWPCSWPGWAGWLFVSFDRPGPPIQNQPLLNRRLYKQPKTAGGGASGGFGSQ